MLTTKRKPLAQLMFCQGCCCGRVDRGKPELPIEALREAWRVGKWNRTVQLTVSGCLGPCDLTNVTLLLTPTEQIWLGHLEGEECYAALANWVAECDQAGMLLPLPEKLAEHHVERWPMVSAD